MGNQQLGPASFQCIIFMILMFSAIAFIGMLIVPKYSIGNEIPQRGLHRLAFFYSANHLFGGLHSVAFQGILAPWVWSLCLNAL